MSNIDDVEKTVLPEIEENPNGLAEIKVTHKTVADILKNLNPQKASGPDNISGKMLKETADETAVVLTKIFNRGLEQGKFPNMWKTANVTPIHKKNDRTEVGNYRPISLLSIVGKCLERCVHTEVFKYLQTNNLLSKLQGAYMPRSSTTTQLLEMYDTIIKNMDAGKELRFLISLKYM